MDLQPLIRHALLSAAKASTHDRRQFLGSILEAEWHTVNDTPDVPHVRNAAAEQLLKCLMRDIVDPARATVDPPITSAPSVPVVDSVSTNLWSTVSVIDVTLDATTPSDNPGGVLSNITNPQGRVDKIMSVPERDLKTLCGDAHHVLRCGRQSTWLLEEKLPSALPTQELVDFVLAVADGDIHLYAEGFRHGPTLSDLL